MCPLFSLSVGDDDDGNDDGDDGGGGGCGSSDGGGTFTNLLGKVALAKGLLCLFVN